MSYFKLTPALTYSLNSMPRGKKHNSQITNSCNAPFTTLTIDRDSNCMICRCEDWLPIPVGRVQDFESIEDVINSPLAKIIQNDIVEKKFTWCAVQHCGILNNNVQYPIFQLSINIDDSCNLWCPSCRRDKIMHTQGPEFDEKLQNIKKVVGWIEQYDKPILIKLSGGGDPFASHITRPLLQNFNAKPNHRLSILTNGLLLKKQMSNSPLMNNLQNLSISIDAACDETYQKVRQGGRWNVLLENLDFVQDAGKSRITTLNFAVQNNNYRDIPAFVELCKNYNMNGNIHQLDDWGTWNNGNAVNPDTWTIKNGTFQQHNVLDSAHPNYNECKQIVQSLNNPKNINLSPRIRKLLGL